MRKLRFVALGLIMALSACGPAPQHGAEVFQPAVPSALSPSVTVAPKTPAVTATPTKPRPKQHVKTASPSPRPVTISTPPFDTVDISLHPWQSGDFQKGIQIYWHGATTAAEARHMAGPLLNYVVGLNANAVTISFPIFTDGARPTHVYTTLNSPTPVDIAMVATSAKLRGLRVTLRPIIDEANIATDGKDWRGTIEPVNVRDWFTSYDQVLAHYGAANQTDSDEFVAGTELGSLQAYSNEWQRTRLKLRASGFKKIISYDSNWDKWLPAPLAARDVDAYPQLSLPDTASITQLVSGFTGWLQQETPAVLRLTTVQEVGIMPRDGSYAHPYATGSQGTLNLAIQANWFTAACTAIKANGLQGIYYWVLDGDTNLSTKSANGGGSFIGRPAEAAIKHCFAS